MTKIEPNITDHKLTRRDNQEDRLTEKPSEPEHKLVQGQEEHKHYSSASTPQEYCGLCLETRAKVDILSPTKSSDNLSFDSQC